LLSPPPPEPTPPLLKPSLQFDAAPGASSFEVEKRASSSWSSVKAAVAFGSKGRNEGAFYCDVKTTKTRTTKQVRGEVKTGSIQTSTQILSL
jgi:hypothetical protein